MENIWGRRKKYFPNVLRSLAKLLCSLKKLCVPSHNFCILSKKFYIPSQNFCVLSQNQLSLDCLLYSLQWFIQLRMFSVCSQSIEFILNLDSSIKKYSQCLVQGTFFGHSKMLNVAYCFKTVTPENKIQ